MYGQDHLDENNEVRFFPIFAATMLSVAIESISFLVDEAVIGHLFEDSALAAVNLLEPYAFVIAFISYLICVDSSAMIVRARSTGDRQKMSAYFSQAIILCYLIGSAFMLLFTEFSRQLVTLAADDPLVLDNALEYFSMIRYLPIVHLLKVFLTTYILYLGGSVPYVFLCALQLIGNAVFSIFYGQRMGVAGVALATVLSTLVVVVLCTGMLFIKKYSLRFRWYLNVAEIKGIAKIGFAEASVFLSMTALEFVFNRFALRNYSVGAVVSVARLINVFKLVVYAGEGIGRYETVALNEYIGRSDRGLMERCAKKSAFISVVLGVILGGAIFFAAGYVVSSFGIDDPETVADTIRLLRVFAFAPVSMCLIRSLGVYYQYTGRVRRTLAMLFTSIAIFPVVLGCVLGKYSLSGMSYGVLTGTVAALLMTVVYIRGNRGESLSHLPHDLGGH